MTGNGSAGWEWTWGGESKGEWEVLRRTGLEGQAGGIQVHWVASASPFDPVFAPAPAVNGGRPGTARR